MSQTGAGAEGHLPADFPLTTARRALLTSLVGVGMGFTVHFPILAPLGREIGLSEVQITFIIAASGLVVFLMSPVWGRLSDRLGRKRILVTGLFGFTFGTVLFNTVLSLGLSAVLTGTTIFVALVLSRMVHALFMAASMPAANAYMADITTIAGRTRGMGAAGAASNIGQILGPAVAALAVISLLTPLWIMAAVAFVNALFVMRFLPEAPKQVEDVGPRPRLRYNDPRIVPFLIVGVLMFTGMGLVQQTMGFRMQDALNLSATETVQAMGLAMLLSAVASLTAQMLIVQRMDLAPFTLLRIAIPMLIVAFIVMAVFESRIALTLAMTLQGFSMGMAGPAYMAGASLAVSRAEQGAVAGVAGSCGPLGFSLGPLIGGALYQAGPSLPFATAAAVYVLLFAGMFWLARRVRTHDET